MPGQWNEWPDYPFCSPKSRKIDLGRWLGEKYSVPAAEQPSRDGESNPDE